MSVVHLTIRVLRRSWPSCWHVEPLQGRSQQCDSDEPKDDASDVLADGARLESAKIVASGVHASDVGFRSGRRGTRTLDLSRVKAAL
jgi:hypothetical protein